MAFIEAGDLNAYLERVNLNALTKNTITQKKQLLKEIEEIRRRRYSIDHEENILGLACIGTPIFGWSGRLEGAISVSGDAKDIYKRIEILLPELLKTAKEISQSMGYFPGALGMKA